MSQGASQSLCLHCGHSFIDDDGECAVVSRVSLKRCGCKCIFAERDGSLTPARVERAALVAESRGIDLETAQELVYLRDIVAATGADGGAERERLIADLASAPLRALFEKDAPASAQLAALSLIRHMQQRAQEFAAAPSEAEEPRR